MARKKSTAGEIGPALPEGVPGGFDVIGDIAVVAIPEEFREHYVDIAASIMKGRKNIRTVLNRTKPAEGDFRIPGYELICGDPGTVTVHKESGFAYMLDLGDTFFNPRLCTERMRVCGMADKGERVLVPFAGTGPFAIPAGAGGARVYAVEANPSACRWLRKNIILNRAGDNVEAILGDARRLPDMFNTEFDRVIAPAPYGFDDYFFTIAELVKKGGFIHFYTFKRPAEIRGIEARYEGAGFLVINRKPCGNVAKGVSRWVFDLKKR